MVQVVRNIKGVKSDYSNATVRLEDVVISSLK